jgi:hypothetical protein
VLHSTLQLGLVRPNSVVLNLKGYQHIKLTLHRQSFLQRCGQTQALTGCYRYTEWPHVGRDPERRGTPAKRDQFDVSRNTDGWAGAIWQGNVKGHEFQTALSKYPNPISGLMYRYSTLAAFPTRGISCLYSSLAGRATCQGKENRFSVKGTKL